MFLAKCYPVFESIPPEFLLIIDGVKLSLSFFVFIQCFSSQKFQVITHLIHSDDDSCARADLLELGFMPSAVLLI